MTTKLATPDPEEGPPDHALIRRAFATIHGDDPFALDGVFAEDCIDHNPLPLQPSGIDGIRYKPAFYRAAAPSAETRVLAIAPEAEGYRVTWTTALTGSGGVTGPAAYQYTGLCRVA